MWKMLVGFAALAVVVVFLLMKSGADVDMTGEKHGSEATSAADPTPAAAPETSAPSAPVAASPSTSEAASAASAP